MHYFQTEDRASLKTSEKREVIGPSMRVGNVRRGRGNEASALVGDGTLEQCHLAVKLR